MTKDIFVEKLDFEKTKLSTKMGIIEFLISSFIWGFLIVNYTPKIYNYILTFLTFLNEGLLKIYISYLIFGLILIPLGLLITFIITELYKLFFNNGKVF